MADDLLLQIGPSAPEIQNFPGEGIQHHGVDGEIPAAGGVFIGKKGIHGHVEIPVAPAGAGFPAGHGDVQIRMPQAQHAEGRAPVVYLAKIGQHFPQLLGSQAVNFQIDVLTGKAHEPVPDVSAHKKGASAGGFHALGNLHCQVLIVQNSSPDSMIPWH